MCLLLEQVLHPVSSPHLLDNHQVDSTLTHIKRKELRLGGLSDIFRLVQWTIET